MMLNSLTKRIPKHCLKAKVAFYGKNINYEKLLKTNHFYQYNAEKTLVFNRNNTIKLGELKDSRIKTRSYNAKDYNNFLQIHPEGTYFTAPELISRLNINNQLIVAGLGELIVGYVYFEMLLSDQYAEICFLNVSSDYRNKGVGTLLLDKAIKQAMKQYWVNNIQISVRVDNKKAERLYNRIGFTEKNVILAFERNLGDYPWGDFV